MLKTVSVSTFVTRRVLSCGCVGMGGGWGAVNDRLKEFRMEA